MVWRRRIPKTHVVKVQTMLNKMKMIKLWSMLCVGAMVIAMSSAAWASPNKSRRDAQTKQTVVTTTQGHRGGAKVVRTTTTTRTVTPVVVTRTVTPVRRTVVVTQPRQVVVRHDDCDMRDNRHQARGHKRQDRYKKNRKNSHKNSHKHHDHDQDRRVVVARR